MRFISLTMPGGLALDIPVLSIVSVESLAAGKVDTPGARSAIFYDLGRGDQPQILADDPERIVRALEAETLQCPRLRVTREDGDFLLLPEDRVVARAELQTGGCVLSVRLGLTKDGPLIGTVTTRETRAEIIAMSSSEIVSDAGATP